MNEDIEKRLRVIKKRVKWARIDLYQGIVGGIFYILGCGYSRWLNQITPADRLFPPLSRYLQNLTIDFRVFLRLSV